MLNRVLILILASITTTYARVKYYAKDSKQTFDQAQSACLASNQTLAFIYNRTLQIKMVKSVAKKYGSKQPGALWVGVKKMDDGMWGWTNNANATKYPIPNWNKNHPKEGRNCAVFVLKTKALSSVDCAKNLTSACFRTDETFETNKL